jgi:hypothetical protein
LSSFCFCGNFYLTGFLSFDFPKDKMSQYIQFNSSAVNASECIGAGWNLIKSDYWLFFGIIFVGLIIGGCVPCVSIFFAGPIAVGIFFTLFTKMRGQPIDFSMLFKGFDKFVPAMVVGIIEALPEIVGQGIRFTFNLSDLSRQIQSPRGSGDFFLQTAPDFALSGGIMLLVIVIALVAILFGIAWRITFFFALPLIADRHLDVGEAIKLSARAGWSNVGGLIVLFILQFFVVLAGVLALCIGLLFVLPIIQASSAVAYRNVFPDTRQPVYNEPPQPTDYGGGFGTPV